MILKPSTVFTVRLKHCEFQSLGIPLVSVPARFHMLAKNGYVFAQGSPKESIHPLGVSI